MKNKKKLSIYLMVVSLILLIQTNSCKKETDEFNEDIPAPAVFNPNLTYGTMTDQEGNVYKTIKIGDYIWMAENLRTTKFNDGTDIPEVEGYNEWINITVRGNFSPAFCWPNTLITNKDTYGALYNAYVVNTGKLAPIGWHIATLAEWTSLVNNLGGERIAGYKLKERGTTHWLNTDIKTDNGSGFTALPGGIRGDVEFRGIGENAYWWSSTPQVPNNSNWECQLEAKFSFVYINSCGCSAGLSVRCVKD